MAAIEPEQEALYGPSINKKNIVYDHWVEVGNEKKLRAEVSYQRCREANRGL
jgi:hypothetical protein